MKQNQSVNPQKNIFLFMFPNDFNYSSYNTKYFFMKSNTLFLFITLFGISFSPFSYSQDNNDPFRLQGEKRLKNIKMLTEAGENAEAYLSFDEKKLIFQTTFGSLQCDQIFTMNIDGSEGYVWKLYETFDIFMAKPDGSNLRQITNAYGYDAEATVSPKGDKIVFTSTRDGDPEIYLMDIDGSNHKRLTHEKGYDGGPFFSLDGSKIVFRASRPKTEEELKDYNDLVENGLVRPTALEIYTMNSDGSNIKQVTNFGRASFAPFFHPDGKRIIFASNINSKTGRDFDLYIINTDGTGLEQITFNETFDGFPMFTRDGKKLIFASNRFNKKEGDTNIFTADWVE